MEWGFFSKDGEFHKGSAKTGWERGFIHEEFRNDVNNIEGDIVREMKAKIDTQIAKEGLK